MLTQQDFLTRAMSSHGDTYIYTDSVYKNTKTPVVIICKSHGRFMQTPENHFRGRGCLACSYERASWKEGDWIKLKGDHKLYAILCEMGEERFVKIGKTVMQIKQRFYGETGLPYNYTKIGVLTKRSGVTAKYISNLENKLHKMLKDYRYLPNVKFNGYTECYNVDIIQDPLFKLVFRSK